MVEGTGQPVAEPDDLGPDLARFRAEFERFRQRTPRGSSADELFVELETAHEELRVAEEEIRTQQEELEQLAQLHRTERWLRDRVVAMLPVAVLVTDARGIIQAANAAAAALLQQRVDHLLGKPVFSFVDPADRSDLRALLARSVASQDDFRTMATLGSRAHRPLQVEMSATVVRDSSELTTRVNWVCLPADARVGAIGTDRQLLAECIVDLAQRALETADLATLVQHAARNCHAAFPVTTWVSISLGSPYEPELLASDSGIAQEADGAQVMVGEGPALDAWSTGHVITSPDLTTDQRWPGLAAWHHGAPPVSVVVVPIGLVDQPVGVLSLYSDDQELVSARLVRDAELLGATLAAVLQEADAKAALSRLADQLQEAMRSRATIEQAKGIVIADRGCTPEEAFDALVEMSSAAGVKVRDVARSVVERRGPGS